jgi:hypothetical protein
MDDEEARAILRAHGEEDIPERGRLRAELRARAQHYADQDAAEAEGEPGDVTAAADLPGDGAEPVAAERRPRRVRTPSPGLRERLSGRQRGGQGKPRRKAKPKRPRVPVDRITGMVWEALGRMATPISPPVGRCMQLQAPVTGLVLEDVIKGTFVDTALQPFARAEEKGKKVFAVAAPPVLVFALEQAQRLPDAQRLPREAFLVPALREALALWDEVAAGKMEEQIARSEKMGPRYEQADRLLAMIFAPPTGGPATSAPPPEAAEDDEAARAQQMAGAAV